MSTPEATRRRQLLDRRNRGTIASAVKLAILTALSVVVTTVLAIIMGNLGAGDTEQYEAIFENASNLRRGDNVLVAGVNVGQVRDIDHVDRTFAKVSFTVDSDLQLTSATRAEIRFENLIGDRYLAVVEGQAPLQTPLEPGGTIPMAQTTPALDLTVLFNGFKPLFEALDPAQVNDLSANLIAVLQGEGGTVRDLLAQTASLTNTLADRDQLIGQVITNLSTTLDTIDGKRSELNLLITELQRWMADLAGDREVIGDSFSSISDLSVELAGFLEEARPVVRDDVAALRRLAAQLNEPASRQELSDTLDRAPRILTEQTRIGTYGSWYSYYLCTFQVKFTLPVLSDIPLLNALQEVLGQVFDLRSTAARCQDGAATTAQGPGLGQGG